MDDPKETSRRAWEANADHWDANFGSDGNDYQKVLIGPATEALLRLKPGESVLDVGCGNGVFARRMAELGAKVLGVDQSAGMVANARARSEGRPGLEFRVADATDAQALRSLGRFDAVVCTMALMDMASIEPLAAALPRLLNSAGRFVFSVLHPCFTGTGAGRIAEERYEGGRLVSAVAVRVSRYLTPATELGMYMDGQPVPHVYFDRPISALLRPFFAAGLVLDAFEEPAFARPAPAHASFWSHRRMHEIPPVLVVRLRLP